MNKYELKEQAIDALKESISYMRESGEDPGDIDLNELADSIVPVYTSDLLDLLRSDYGTFGWVDPEQGATESVTDIVSWNAYNFIYQVMSDNLDEVIDEISQSTIDLLKTSDPRIVMGGKLTQYCPDDCILEMREDYISGTGENISIDDWLDCWETADLDELDGATDDQINYLEIDNNGNWQVVE